MIVIVTGLLLFHAGSSRSGDESAEQPAREQGMLLFHSQKQRIDDSGEVKKRSETIRILEDVTTDPKLSPTKKAIFAETLRGVSAHACTHAHTYTHLYACLWILHTSESGGTRAITSQ